MIVIKTNMSNDKKNIIDLQKDKDLQNLVQSTVVMIKNMVRTNAFWVPSEPRTSRYQYDNIGYRSEIYFQVKTVKKIYTELIAAGSRKKMLE